MWEKIAQPGQSLPLLDRHDQQRDRLSYEFQIGCGTERRRRNRDGGMIFIKQPGFSVGRAAILEHQFYLGRLRTEVNHHQG